MIVIDCVSSPPLDAMRVAGVSGVSRYLSLPQADTAWKRITLTEYVNLRGAGFDVLLNWEYAADDWLGGATAGQLHAAYAVQQARALGYPAGCAIPGSADFNMTHDQWNGPGWQYARAYSQGIRAGGYRAGVYGPWDVLEWCATTGWFDMYWQAGMSTSWSGGRNAALWPGAHLRQRYETTIGGVQCDVNDIIQANYGQYAVDAATTGGDMPGEYSPDTARAIAIGATQYGYVQYTDPPWDDDLKTYNLKAVEGRLAEQIKAVAVPAPAPVDLDALVAALKPLIPTAAQIADELAKRLQS
jgi:hypothetical protein